jgi:hypothetical protein
MGLKMVISAGGVDQNSALTRGEAAGNTPFESFPLPVLAVVLVVVVVVMAVVVVVVVLASMV